MKIKAGQKLIDKIRGKKKHNKNNIKDIWGRTIYSQDGEDVVLYSYIMNGKSSDYKGFFVDVGALRPQRYSNTFIFYKMGWNGINIDGTPGSMAKFNEERPRDINIEAVVSDNNSEKVSYYIFEESALNCFNKECAEAYISEGWKLNNIVQLQPKTINDILDTYVPKNKKIDFINIDTEGIDEKIVKSINYEKYAPDYFIIEECDFINKDFAQYKELSNIYKFLYLKNYIVVGKTMRSIIYKKIERRI